MTLKRRNMEMAGSVAKTIFSRNFLYNLKTEDHLLTRENGKGKRHVSSESDLTSNEFPL